MIVSNTSDTKEMTVMMSSACDAADYTAAHIPGAMHIPLSFIQGELLYLPRGKPIVTYCT